VAFISPLQASVVNNAGQELTDVRAHRDKMPSSSYAVMDSGWKYMYDKYNDVYRYIPLNGDIAGCCAFTDQNRDPFWSPAGATRGNIRNAIKLPFNPNKTQRDGLYKKGINPVVGMPGQGIILFGDKTLLAKPSAFDRINVRRLFILLEKSIARMANSFLFEFNDSFTRSRFVSTVEPFLTNVQGRQGIQDFAIVCDESNNSGEVVDRNEFRGDIYVKPSRSINFIQLQFVAVRSGVSFSEITG
jgi:phage tail sheath protein FI